MTDPKPPSEGSEPLNEKWYERTRYQILLFAGGVALFVLVGGLILDWYIEPKSSGQKKDLVQALGLITAGVAGAVGIYFTWRGQRQAREAQEINQRNTLEQLEQSRNELALNREGQLTDRFTRAIDQLGATDDKTGKPRREVRLGGIYALERIARDSPERDYSTVIEVLTAYIRENTSQAPGPSKGFSQAASTLNEATADAEGWAEQTASPGIQRPTADIQAILDVLSRTQARVPEEYRTRLDLHQANLQGAILQGINLRRANLRGVNLQVAYLQGANLQGAVLDGANFLGANLRETNFQGAHLPAAILEGADLRGANLQEAHLVGAILGGARLREADLRSANLQGVDLQGVDLQGCVLIGTNLQGAYLQGAKVTDKQLVDTLSLRDATMPDGSKHS